MSKEPIRVDSRSWTDGGQPVNTQNVQRKGAVFLSLLLGALFSFLFLGLGLFLDRMPTPLGIASRAEPVLHYGGALLWLASACLFAKAMPWAERRLKTSHQNVGTPQSWAFLKHFAGSGTPSNPPEQN